MRTGLLVKALGAQLLVTLSASQLWAASCVNPPATAQALAQFRSDPKAIITPDTDTRSIEGLVRDLAGTDASLAAILVQLAEGTTPRFQAAIAAGLAQAAVACSNVDQQAALLIQQAVAGFDNGEFQNAFAAVAGDLSTAAVEAAQSSATGSVGSVIVTNPNTSPRPSTQFSVGGTTAPVQVTAAALTNNPTNAITPTTTAASPVSATR